MKKGLFKALVITLMMLMMMGCVTVFADGENKKVNDARKGVLQVQLYYKDKNGTEAIIGGGSGFLINEDTVLTCYHVLHIEGTNNYTQADDVFEDFNPDNIIIRVVTRDDVTLKAKIVNESAAKDFAIIELEQSISGRTPLALNDTGAIAATSEVFALGFPDVVSEFQNKNTYTYDDVTVESGRVTKTNESDGVKYIQHNATLSSGYSGGPLVNADGVVVAMNRGSVENNYYSVSIDQITATLDDLGIAYERGYIGGENPTEPETTSGNEETTEEIETPEEPEPETEKIEKPTVAEDTTKSESGMNTTTIIIIVSVVVVVIIIIIILIATLGGKKNKPTKTVSQPTRQPGGYPGTVPGQNPGMQGQRPTPSMPTYPMGNEGGEATTVLNEGGDATTVLGAGAQSAKTIVRVKNGERITINRPEFMIGKERRRVDYCVSDNSSISRTHAKVVNRGGQLFLIDMNATNGTFINGTKVAPGQETRLSSGDRFKLADEEFQVL